MALVEAEKSALSLTRFRNATDANLVSIALGGCWNWRGVIGKNRQRRRRMDPRECSFVTCSNSTNRVCYLLFDTNAASNKDVPSPP